MNNAAITFLGSGSTGNAALIEVGQSRILLDCGFSGREIHRRLALAGLEEEPPQAILLTHEHSDHTRGVERLAWLWEIPVYLTRGTSTGISWQKRPPAVELSFVQPGVPFSLGEFLVLPFALSHDAREPVGYTFTFPGGARLGVATDLGYANAEAIEALKGCHWLGLEANHDLNLLRQGPYPAFLKRRILSRRGHLSNPSAAHLLQRVASSQLQHLFALHLSQTNNQPPLAYDCLSQQIEKLGLPTALSVIAPNKTQRFPLLPGQLSLPFD